MSQPKNALHGVTLKAIVEDLVARHGWPALGELIPLRCFLQNPSVNSSLKFLRKTPWARSKVEALYLHDNQASMSEARRKARRASQNLRRAARRAHKEAVGEE